MNVEGSVPAVASGKALEKDIKATENAEMLKETNARLAKVADILTVTLNEVKDKVENELLLSKRLENDLEREKQLVKQTMEKLDEEIARREAFRTNFGNEIQQERDVQAGLFVKLDVNVAQRFEYAEKLKGILEALKQSRSSPTKQQEASLSKSISSLHKSSSLGKDIMKSNELEIDE